MAATGRPTACNGREIVDSTPPGSANAYKITSASTVQATVKSDLKYTGNVDAAKAVGRAIAEKARAAGVTKVAFDRAGFRYHGRVKALADAARESGLEF